MPNPGKTFLDWLGSFFVYETPPPMSGERLKRFQLMGMSNKQLRKLVPTPSHYSKRQLVEKIMTKTKPLDGGIER